MKPFSTCTIALASTLALLAPTTYADDLHSGAISEIVSAINNRPTSVPATANIETGFSPDAGAEALVLKVINAAQHKLRLQAYSFTSPTVLAALLAARRRGVDVRVVVDHDSNTSDDRSGKARHALGALINAGIPTRTIAAYAIHHDKVIIVDGRHVQTGSFNYSTAAAHRNSENVLVIWNNPALAATYLHHWQSRYDQGQDYRPGY